MGSFSGHALPGSFFLAFGIWWTIQVFRRYYSSLLRNSTPFRSTITFSWDFLCGRMKYWEIEGIVLVIVTTVGFIAEICTAFVDGKFTYLGNGQHATMFFFFGLAGFITILVHKGVPLPEGTPYAMWVAALLVEGILFHFHLHGRTSMDIQIHTLLIYIIIGNITGAFIEMCFRQSVCAVLTRVYFVFLQGTWFWQAGFILYNPIRGAKPWDEENHEQMMIITMMFAWHMAAIIIFMLGTAAIIGCIYRHKYGPFEHLSDSDDSLKMNLLHKDSNGHTVINFHDDSESDVEYERQKGPLLNGHRKSP